MFESVLVANRGEIAVRVIVTLRRLGIRSVAVYSDADRDALHVELADTAVRLGPAPAPESYLSIERVLAAVDESGAQAVHPGYGFLSENPAFARACAAAGVTFIGPSAEAMEALGDKVAAKQVAIAAGVPVLPGLHRLGLSDAEILDFVAEQDVLPVMVKAAAGGGGRGMRVVREPSELAGALAAARREALAGFGDDSLLVERYVERSRHIEVQVVADAHGRVLHLGERECSLQRRHQKVVEEAPSPAVTPEVRRRLGEAAVSLFSRVGYVGAGTCEFLVPYEAPDEFFFLEVNARLQVEHPVTECITGLDLVEAQLRIAAGEPLAQRQEDIRLNGHAVEVRVCAEDPAANFLPATGRILHYREPVGSGVRTDTGVRGGSVVGTHYDSLLAKVIVHASDRATALERLSRALTGFRALGITTTAGYLRRLIDSPEVRRGDLDTGLIGRGVVDTAPDPAVVETAAAAVVDAETDRLAAAATGDPWDTLIGFRVDGPEPLALILRVPDGTTREVAAGATHPGARLDPDDVTEDGTAVRWVAVGADAVRMEIVEPTVNDPDRVGDGALEAPMPGTVLSVRAAAGDEVAEGQVLAVIESMKMELSLVAPGPATVGTVHVRAGESVRQGQPVIDLVAR